VIEHNRRTQQAPSEANQPEREHKRRQYFQSPQERGLLVREPVPQ